MQDAPWRALAHRWFVQYNPLYLVSAALVLVGVFLVSDGLARSEGLTSELWLTAVVELYQALLIGGAALLYRIGQRRPAVMLALLEVVYLCDLTLQTLVASHLGAVGVAASALWLALFVVKLHALAWALRLRLSPGAALLPSLGAAGLAILPHLLSHRVLVPRSATLLVVWWLFGLAAAGLWSERRVSSRDSLDRWGQTVLRRATRAAWIVWLVLPVGHLLWWSSDFDLRPLPLLFAAATLLATRWMKTEAGVWIAVILALVGVAHLEPVALCSAATMAALVLALRGWRPQPVTVSRAASPTAAHPYRLPPGSAPETESYRPAWHRPEARRLYLGALVLLWLALWSAGWQGGAWPAHRLWLDLPLSALLLLVAWRRRLYLALVPLVMVNGHLALERGLVSAPRSSLQWGVVVLASGFAALLVGLLVNWRARGRSHGSEGG